MVKLKEGGDGQHLSSCPRPSRALAELSLKFSSSQTLLTRANTVRRQFISSLNLTASPNGALLIMSRSHIQISKYVSEEVVEIDMQAPDSDLRLFLDSRIDDSEDLGWVLADCESGLEMIMDQIIKNAASR